MTEPTETLPVRCLDCGAVIVPVNGWTHKYVGNDHIPVVEWPFAILAIEAEARDANRSTPYDLGNTGLLTAMRPNAKHRKELDGQHRAMSTEPTTQADLLIEAWREYTIRFATPDSPVLGSETPIRDAFAAGWDAAIEAEARDATGLREALERILLLATDQQENLGTTRQGFASAVERTARAALREGGERP